MLSCFYPVSCKFNFIQKWKYIYLDYARLFTRKLLCCIIPYPSTICILVTLYSSKQVIQWYFYHHPFYTILKPSIRYIYSPNILLIDEKTISVVHLFPYFLFFSSWENPLSVTILSPCSLVCCSLVKQYVQF